MGLESAPGLESRGGLSNVGIRATHLRLEATPAPQEVLPPDPGPNQFLLKSKIGSEIESRVAIVARSGCLKASEGPFPGERLRGARGPAMVCGWG